MDRPSSTLPGSRADPGRVLLERLRSGAEWIRGLSRVSGQRRRPALTLPVPLVDGLARDEENPPTGAGIAPDLGFRAEPQRDFFHVRPPSLPRSVGAIATVRVHRLIPDQTPPFRGWRLAKQPVVGKYRFHGVIPGFLLTRVPLQHRLPLGIEPRSAGIIARNGLAFPEVSSAMASAMILGQT